jgi:predicted SAM-dependent methyltransferase
MNSNLTTEKKICIDVGGGKLDTNKIERYKRYIGQDYCPANYFTIDLTPLPGTRVVCDLTQGLPFKNNSVDELICIHVLEHINNLKEIMRELHRVLKIGGTLKVWVPHCFSAIAFGDSTHVRFFTFETLKQFDKENQASYYYDFHFDFKYSRIQVLRRWYKFNVFDQFLEKLINRNQRKGERLLKILPYKEWEVYSELKKGTV